MRKPGELSKQERLRQAAPKSLKFAEDFLKWWWVSGPEIISPSALAKEAKDAVKVAGGKLPKEKP